METITNIASTATTTVSNLIYGDQTKKNETEGKEPVSGEQGQGTVTDPYDHGNSPTPLETADKKTFLDYNNTTSKDSASSTATKPSAESNDFLKLAPVIDGPKHEEGAPKIHTNTEDTTYTGMPIVPLNPDVATSGVNTTSSTATESAKVADKAGVTDKVWKETPLDDISRSGAPGAGPTAPEPAAKAAAPDSVAATSEIPKDSTTANKSPITHKESTTSDGSISPKTGAALPAATTDSMGSVAEKPSHKTEPRKSSPTGEEKSSKMSHLKEKLKDKLHIGSKDK